VFCERYAPVDFSFENNDHLEVCAAFEKSADDPRPWIMIHPYYGRITVQPSSLEIDNSKMNVSEIKTEVIETILQDYPKTAVVPADKIKNNVEECNASLGAASIEKINSIGVKPLTISKTSAFINKSNSKVSKLLSTTADSETYINKLNKLKASVNSFSTAPADVITQTIDILRTTAELPLSVTDKLTSYTAMISDAENSFLLGTVSLADKFLYMSNVGSIISAMCLSVSRPLATDYSNRVDVLNTIDTLLDANTTYIQTLDGIQTANGGSIDSFVPDATALFQLNQLLNYTISNLFNIALDAKQERSIILEEDSNWIILAHRFYGLKSDDSTIEQMIRNNGGGLNELLQVRKNRKIVYYI
jgi:hypothetical protein